MCYLSDHEVMTQNVSLSCPVHVIWTGHRMSKLMLNVKYLLLLSFLTESEFYNLGYIQGALTQKRQFLVICTTFRSNFHVG